tara:strand:+ start:2770 stop:3318 length:549 start_codon:yes stop_codon:yes gene_type:complete
MKKNGASVVITHQILEGKQDAYEEWLGKIDPLCRQSPGHIDSQIIRPIPDLTYTYTVIIRFDSIGNLKNWMSSKQRKELIAEVRPLLARDDQYSINSGLDFLFSNPGDIKTPVRWKQYLITWSAIYPLVLMIPFVILPLLRMVNIPKNIFFDTLIITGIVVVLMVYIIMPRYTRLIRPWLFK